MFRLMLACAAALTLATANPRADEDKPKEKQSFLIDVVNHYSEGRQKALRDREKDDADAKVRGEVLAWKQRVLSNTRQDILNARSALKAKATLPADVEQWVARHPEVNRLKGEIEYCEELKEQTYKRA